MNKQRDYTTCFSVGKLVFFVVVAIGSIYGWLVNLMDVIHYVKATHPFVASGLFVLRCIGIVVEPLGAFLGIWY